MNVSKEADAAFVLETSARRRIAFRPVNEEYGTSMGASQRRALDCWRVHRVRREHPRRPFLRRGLAAVSQTLDAART